MRIAVMPEGKDPDDILRHEGAEALKAIISTAASLTDALWERVGQEFRLDDPTARAAFFQQVRDMVRTIGHNQTRQAYGDEIEHRIQSLRTTLRGGTASGQALAGTKRIRRPQTGAKARLSAMLSLLIAHPERIADIYEDLAMVDFGRLASDFRLEEIKKEMLDLVIHDPDLDADGLKHHLSEKGHGQILSDLYSDDMIARLGMHPNDMATQKVGTLLDELLARLKR